VTHLYNIFDRELYLHMLEERFVRKQVHPTEPLAILNYAEKATFEREWNEVTLQCRGLIYNTTTLEIVARPFKKFFNWGEPACPVTKTDGYVTVTNKMDGSLGILYKLPSTGELAIATRGSFASDQAIRATKMLKQKYLAFGPGQRFVPSTGVTYLFEIVYPENRIVLDYGDEEALYLLGCVDIRTGHTAGPEDDWASRWQGPVTKVFEQESFEDALAIPPRSNAEGIVVHFLNTDERVKIKQEDYVRLHRLITGMNARTIWEALGEGQSIEELKEGVPEEFWPWMDTVADELESELEHTISDALGDFQGILRDLDERWGDNWTRKEFAESAVRSKFKSYLFLILDGRDIKDAVWKTLKPSAERSMVTISEDANLCHS
jgi:RNA ligase